MARDINTKKLKKNAFRYSKVRGETASRIRIPGGVINAGSMAKIAEVAEKYGNGTIFVTNRQGVELPGIALEDMDAVNKMIQSIIDDSDGDGPLARGARERADAGGGDLPGRGQRLRHGRVPQPRAGGGLHRHHSS